MISEPSASKAQVSEPRDTVDAMNKGMDMIPYEEKSFDESVVKGSFRTDSDYAAEEKREIMRQSIKGSMISQKGKKGIKAINKEAENVGCCAAFCGGKEPAKKSN